MKQMSITVQDEMVVHRFNLDIYKKALGAPCQCGMFAIDNHQIKIEIPDKLEERHVYTGVSEDEQRELFMLVPEYLYYKEDQVVCTEYTDDRGQSEYRLEILASKVSIKNGRLHYKVLFSFNFGDSSYEYNEDQTPIDKVADHMRMAEYSEMDYVKQMLINQTLTGTLKEIAPYMVTYNWSLY